MSFRSIIAIVASLASVNAHMIMQSPVPFSVDKIDSGPITASSFPCKFDLGYTVSTMNTMTVGEKQTLKFKGTAVHGGGSCQLSITTDPEPTANSVFKVIKTMEGGCPGVDGAEEFDYEIPPSIPNGRVTFAWTWFAKLSGGPEMYMNCAPGMVKGGAANKAAFDALPDMLVANIATSSCKSPTSKVLKIPNPGEDVVRAGSEADIVDGTGDCGASSGGATPAQPSGATPTQPSSPAGQAPSSPADDYPAQSSAATPPSTPSAPPSNPGGAYEPAASGAPAVASTTLATVTGTPAGTGSPAKPTAPAAPGTGAPAAPGTGYSAVPAKPSLPAASGTGAPAAPGTGYSAAPAKPSLPAASGTGAPAAPGIGNPAAPSSPSAPSPPTTGGVSGTSCSTPGAIVCNGEKQFGVCNNGTVVFQDVSEGTTCANGAVSKRSFNSRIARSRYMRAKVAAN